MGRGLWKEWVPRIYMLIRPIVYGVARDYIHGQFSESYNIMAKLCHIKRGFLSVGPRY